MNLGLGAERAIFPFPTVFFYPFAELSSIFIKFENAVCKLFQFVVWEKELMISLRSVIVGTRYCYHLDSGLGAESWIDLEIKYFKPISQFASVNHSEEVLDSDLDGLGYILNRCAYPVPKMYNLTYVTHMVCV